MMTDVGDAARYGICNMTGGRPVYTTYTLKHKHSSYLLCKLTAIRTSCMLEKKVWDGSCAPGLRSGTAREGRIAKKPDFGIT